MTIEDPESSQLTSVLGEIAIADAEVDHWLNLMLAELLGIDQNLVAVLVQSDSSVRKADKLKRLIGMSSAAQQHPEIVEILVKVPSLKAQRDQALHAFYLAEDAEQPLRRFRTRGATPDISVSELTSLRDEIRRLLVLLEQATVGLSVDRARLGDIGELQRDCFEILASLRLHARRDFPALCELSGRGQEFEVALEGQGCWKLADDLVELGPVEWPLRIRAIAKVQPLNGHVELRLRDGSVVSGGDTGWRNVLNQVRRVTPEANQRFWRRINGAEQYVADESSWWPTSGLADRLTAASSRRLVERMQAERESFLPRDT